MNSTFMRMAKQAGVNVGDINALWKAGKKQAARERLKKGSARKIHRAMALLRQNLVQLVEAKNTALAAAKLEQEAAVLEQEAKAKKSKVTSD